MTLNSPARLETTSTAAPDARSRSTHRWWALAILALAQSLVILDATIVNIALPSIGGQLHLDTAGLSWVITAYVLPFGGLLLLGGRLADRYGHRRLFLIGTAGFIVGSALAGFSTSGILLFSARAIQGASAALLAPAALALVTQLFTSNTDRGKALGIWGAVAGFGSAAGVLLGGVLTAVFGWQAVFFVNLPVGILVLASLPSLLNRDPKRAAERLDAPGAAAITAGLIAVVGALTSAERLGFAHPLTLALFAAAAVLIATFIVIEHRSTSPLVPFSIFANRAVTAGNLVILLLGGAIVALFFALSVYMQTVLHYDALTAGVAQLPLAGALVVVAGIVPSLIVRLGMRNTLAISLLVMAGGLLWLATAPSDAQFVTQLLGPSLLIGMGLGGAAVSGTQLAVHGVTPTDAGLAGGLVNASQQIGGALGIAVLGTIAASRTAAVQQQGAAAADALTAGFSWVFLGSAMLAVAGAIIAVTVRDRHLTPAAAARSAAKDLSA